MRSGRGTVGSLCPGAAARGALERRPRYDAATVASVSGTTLR